MLNIKLEQQMINQQQAEVHGGEVASMDDEIQIVSDKAVTKL